MGADEFCCHFYIKGDFMPGCTVEGELVGIPQSAPACVFIGSGVLDPLLFHIWGDFYLDGPWLLISSERIPSNGVLQIPVQLSAFPGSSYQNILSSVS